MVHILSSIGFMLIAIAALALISFELLRHADEIRRALGLARLDDRGRVIRPRHDRIP